MATWAKYSRLCCRRWTRRLFQWRASMLGTSHSTPPAPVTVCVFIANLSHFVVINIAYTFPRSHIHMCVRSKGATTMPLTSIPDKYFRGLIWCHVADMYVCVSLLRMTPVILNLFSFNTQSESTNTRAYTRSNHSTRVHVSLERRWCMYPNFSH